MKSKIYKKKILHRNLFVAASFIIIAVGLYFLLHPRRTTAAWYNDSYAYRVKLTIGNTGSVQTNQKVSFSINTQTLISGSKMLSNCNDVRFTTTDNQSLQYYLNTAGGACNTASTNYYILFPVINTGNNIIYMYYGNPNALNGSQPAQFSQATFTPNSGPSSGSEEIGPAPVLNWKLNEGSGSTLNDSSGQNNSGSLGTGSSAPSWRTSSECVSSSCLYYQATNQSAARTYNNDVELNPSTNALTVSLWYKHPQTPSGTQVLLSRYNTAGYKIYLTAAGLLCFGIDADSVWDPEDSVCTPSSVIDTKWHFVSAVKTASPSPTLALYFDGNQLAYKSSLTATGSLSGTSPPIYLGVDSAGTGSSYAGWLDDIKIYDYARSQSQINTEYNSPDISKGSTANLGSNITEKNLSNGLVGYWKMDEASSPSLDYSGNGNIGTWTNSPTSTNGKFGKGLSFAGTNDYLDISASSSLEPGNITVASYIYVAGNDTAGFLAHWNGSGSNGWSYEFSISSGKLSLMFQNGITNTVNITSSSSIPQNQWSQVAFTYDGSKVYLYINGVQDSTYANYTGGIYYGASPGFSHIGRADYEFNYSLDEVRIYNRALSANEISNLYEWAPGPVAKWNFDEGSGTVVNDITGNGNNGTLGTGSSAPSWTTGKYGKAMNFNGSGNYVYGSDTNFPSGTTPRTISAWLKSTKVDALNNYDNILFYGTNSANSSVIFGMGYDTNIGVQNACYVSQYGNALGTAKAVNDGKWHYCTAIFDGTSWTIYLDGVYSNSKTMTTNTTLGGSFNIGTAGSLGGFFTGQVDDLTVYNYPRTQKQIIADMNSNHPPQNNNGPLVYYKFEEGFGTAVRNYGILGSNQDLNFGSNAPVPVWSEDGKFGKSVSFGTQSETHSNNYNAALNYTGTGGLTLSAWIKPSSSETDGGYLISKPWNGSGGYNYYLQFNSNRTITFGLSGATSYSLSTVNTIPLNEWHQVTATLDASNNKTAVYIDGRPSISDTNTVTNWTATNSSIPLAVGCIYPYTTNCAAGTSFAFNGLMDEVKVYNYALNADEVKADYNKSSSISLGSLSDTSGLTGGSIASNSATAAYCVPGSTDSCNPPVGEWNFDEKTGTTAYDSSGSNYSLSLTSPTWTSGKIGGCLSYDASSSRSETSTTVTLGSSGTLSAWIYPTNANTTYNQVIDWGGGTLPGKAFRLFWYGSAASTTRRIDFQSNTNNSQDDLYSTLNTAPENRWYHVEAVWNSSGKYLYINGVLVNSNTKVEDGTGVTSTLRIGVQYSWWVPSYTYYFGGKIDNVRWYNYARTPAQVAWDYNRGKPVAWYQLDECKGTTVYSRNDPYNPALNGNIGIGSSGSQTSAGTCNSGTSTEAWNNGTNGKFGGSLNLDGVDDWVTIGSGSYNSFGTSDFSVSGWLKTSNAGSQSCIASIAGSAAGWRFGYTTGKPYFLYGDGTNYNEGAIGNTSINDNIWHLITVVYLHANRVNAYVDGNYTGYVSVSNVTGSATNGTNLWLGSMMGTSNGLVNGQIDDIRIYNYPLTLPQIRDIYNNGAVKFGN